MGEAEGPTGYLVGGTQQAPPPYRFIPCPPETLGVEQEQRVGKIPLHPLPAWSPESHSGVELP